MALIDFFKKIEPDKEKSPLLHTAYDAFFTFAFTPNTVTPDGGTHIKDGMDLKRTMFYVVIALQLCFLFGTYNIGHQHFLALGVHESFLAGFHLKLAYGLVKLLPIFIVANVVGLGIEFWYASNRGHGVEEGFLVSGALIPLIMPPDVPLIWLAFSVAFAVILGKEAFGGTGMNVWNIALLSRVFIFFAYPTTISGDEVWVAGLTSTEAGAAVDYTWWQTGFFNGIFEAFGWSTFDPGLTVADGYTGATPLALAANGIPGTDLVGWEAVTSVYSESQMWWGTIPGSIGETCKPFIIVGAILLILTKIASWRIMLSMVIGAALAGMGMNALGLTPFMEVPWQYHFYMGSFFFAMAFMATDPVTASGTLTGKWIYGFFIGVIGMIIRVLNPAYPEGWMLAILLLNTFSATIDNYVLKANIKKRLQRA
ncbi:MAG: NADH:ubiquinone reductase (Na(+)-transporting) subunit B [Bacteroidia bacterium]|nr:NADH:ubiquinone reductase (Na(+)-transporting) subunit B [Bacteroidia bacterium]